MLQKKKKKLNKQIKKIVLFFALMHVTVFLIVLQIYVESRFQHFEKIESQLSSAVFGPLRFLEVNVNSQF